MTISIDALERVASKTWQATDQQRLGSWTLRAAEGLPGARTARSPSATRACRCRLPSSACGSGTGLAACQRWSPSRSRSAVSTALADAAAELGGKGLYLQVENDNAAAQALYRGIGFTDHHGYHYRVEPAS